MKPVELRRQALPFAGVCHIHRAEEDDGVSNWAPCPSGTKAFAVKFEDGKIR